MKKLFLAIASLFLLSSAANAAVCNDPSGFAKLKGPITQGDLLILGSTDCQSVVDGGTNTPTVPAYKTPADFGAKCDGASDDSLAIQAWFDGIKTYQFVGWGLAGRTCIVGNNTNLNPLLKGILMVRSQTLVFGNFMTIKWQNATSNNYGMNLTDMASADQVHGANSVEISDLILDGNRAGQTNSIGQAGLLYIIASTRVILRNDQTLNSRADGLYIGGDSTAATNSTFVVVINHTSTNSYRNNASIVGTDRVSFLGGYFNGACNVNTDGGPESGIDVESNAGTTTLNTNLYMENISAVGNGAASAGCTLPATGGAGVSFYGPAGTNNQLINANVSGNGRYGLDSAAGYNPTNVRVQGIGGSNNATALINSANIVDWFPLAIQKGAANSCGTGVACVGIPN